MKKISLFILLLSPLLLSSCTKGKEPSPDLITYNMVLVKGGPFIMGCTPEQENDCREDENPSHVVQLNDFFISKYEVTQKMWVDIMGEKSFWFPGCDQCPAEMVHQAEIQDFLDKLNAKTGKEYRLPTEAEWEYAARGGKQSHGYKYAGSDSLTVVAWFDANASGTTHPVGEKKANELGLFDMSGNVGEWCQDWYDAYPDAPQFNPTGPDEPTTHYKIHRGGSWESSADNCRVSYRGARPSASWNVVGFRLARNP